MVHVCQYLAHTAQKEPLKVLTVCGGRQRTAAEFLQRVAALKQVLRSDLGLKRGDTVVLAAENSDYLLEALLAVTAVGAVAAPLNWRWGLAEAAAALRLCQPRLLLVDWPCVKYADLAATQAGCRACLVGHSPETCGRLVALEQLLPEHRGCPFTYELAPASAALVCFTSGTTGAPKGVLLSHQAFHFQAAAKVAAVGYTSSDIFLHAAPLFHIGGLSSLFALFMVGAVHVCLPRFSAAVAVQLVAQHQVTAFIAVPTILRDMAQAVGTRALPSVLKVLVGGGEFPMSLMQQCRSSFPCAHFSIAYGMTEACSSITFSRLALPAERGGDAVCVGHAPPGIQIRVEPLGKQEAADAGCSLGEVLTRGPHLMLGYWGAVASSTQRNPGGWLRTGDLGRLDAQGRLWLAGRIKEVIKSGGENVHAQEVERMLLTHPAVVAACVVGLPHERFGEQVAALVEVAPGSRQPGSAQAADIKAHCLAAGLSAFKVPRCIVLQPHALPRNAGGKVLREAVKYRLQAMCRADDLTPKADARL